MANRQPDEYPRKPDEYPEIMSKMDPLIIRVSATVLLVGSTTYTAKIKLGYKFNGFVVNVTGVGIPIYTEEVDIANASTTNKSRQNGMSDAYNKVAEKATEWMDNLEKSMIDDTKEKNIVDLLREIKYQMHFDSSGHKYPAIIKPNEPGYNEEEYDPRMEVCTEVPTYITDIYKLLAEMNARLNNLMVVMASDGTGQNINPQDTDYGKNCLINSVNVLYNDTTHGFDVAYNYGDHIDAGLNTRIGDITNPDTNSVIGKLDSISTNVDTVAIKVETVHRAIGTGDSDHTVQKQLEAIATDVVSLSGQSATNATTISTAITNGLNQLVAQMNTMNAKIGTSTNNDTLFSLSYDIKIDTNNILSKPILTMDSAHVGYLESWGANMYDENGNDYFIVDFREFFKARDNNGNAYVSSADKLNLGMYQFDGNDNRWTMRTKADPVVIRNNSLMNYNISQGKYTQTGGPAWGIMVSENKVPFD